MSWDPTGIVTSDAFRDYVEELRNTALDGEKVRSDNDKSSHQRQQREQRMNINIKKTGLAALLAFAVMSSIVAAPAAAGGIAFDGESSAPSPEIEADVTIDEWNAADFDEPLEYYDDSGEPTSLPASVNESNDNPITVTATDIDFDQADQFPRKSAEDGDNSASALDASEWTASGATVSETTTAPGVDALNYAGTASSDSASYSNFSVSDGEKAYVTVAADVNSASETPTLRVNDTDGDYVEVELYNSSASADSTTILANSTGEGNVLQVQLGDLTVQGSGDGTLDETTEITIQGDADADVSVLDAQRTRELQFGERLEDTDDDNELETVEVTQPNGAYTVANMGGFDEVMSSATFYGVTVDAHFSAGDLVDDENVDATFSADNDYPQWDSVGTFNYKLQLPTGFDLSYANTELTDSPELPGERYKNVEVAEGVGDTDFSDISSYSEVTSSYDSSEVTLDSTVSSGTVYAISYDVVLTSGEVSAIENVGGGGAPMDSTGGLWDSIISIPGAIVSAVLGFVGIRRLGA